MLTRRTFSAGMFAAGLAPALNSGLIPAANAASRMTDDGLHTEDWFLESLLELADDAIEATQKGKGLAIMWELKGCSYCRDTHLKNFSQARIESFIRQHFEVVQLNLIGSRIVTDFDGEKIGEKAMAEKYGVRFTPTFQFFTGPVAEIGKRKPREREVARGQGYMEPDKFLAMFRFVQEKAYERGSLADYLKSAGG